MLNKKSMMTKKMNKGWNKTTKHWEKVELQTRKTNLAWGNISMTTMGKRLECLIKEKGMTITEVAKQTGMPKSSVHNIISGRMPTNPKSLEKLCELLETSLDYLMFGKVHEPTELTISQSDIADGCSIRISKFRRSK